MNSRWTVPLLVALFCVLTLGMVYITRKPLCIDSKVVDKIDRGSESVYRCGLNRHVPFSPYFYEKLPSLEARIQQIEKVLEVIAPIHSKVKIVILAEKPSYFLVKDNVIYIGETLLPARGHLEKALLKVWYRENSQHLFAYENLFEEVFTDFMLYLVKGSIKIEDPFKGVRTRIAGSRWPQVLKSAQGYCNSPWKNSEHYQFCEQAKQQDLPIKDQIIELSLRPLLVSSWIESYQLLSFKDQHLMFQNMKKLVADEHDPDLPLVKTGGAFAQSAPLAEASEAIKNLSNYLTSSQLMQSSSAHKIFVTLVANQLSRFGYNENFGGAYFDVLYITDAKVSVKSDQFKHFLNLAKQHPSMKIAIKDKESLWMMPSMYPISWKSLEYIKANRTVYSKCGSYDFNFIWQFANMTDKLMILNKCDDSKNIVNLSGYIDEGPEAFGAQNKKVPFIQFHIPSLLMRKDQLSRVQDIYELINRREIENPVFQSLGWQQLRWSERAQAYQPQSYIEGIEWFKTQEN